MEGHLQPEMLGHGLRWEGLLNISFLHQEVLGSSNFFSS